ncbi:Ig-like domain-containing protein [Paenibacillus xylanexedens]|uniref:Ig-like domain-containing protein n=1 Tax=Paenibacillus xylanexedens TaxID=528191 RepID=UPI0016438CD9|nr:Ig-like domain-containing protein [Paenibacillus xylanexedens]
MTTTRLARKGIIFLLVLLLTVQGSLGFLSNNNKAYAAEDDPRWEEIFFESTVPAANTVDVDGKEPLVINFKEAVRKANSDVKLYIDRYQDGIQEEIIYINSEDVLIGDPSADPEVPASSTGTGTQVTIKHKELPGGTYYIMYDAGAFVTVANNQGIGSPSSGLWKFTTKGIGTAKPTAFFPMKGAGSVPLASNVQLNYSEAIKAGTGEIQIMQGNNVFEKFNVKDSNRIRINGSSITITPSKNFENNATYSVLVPEGAFRDLKQGNDVSSIEQGEWSFTAFQSDPTALTVTNLSPANGTSGVPLTGDLFVTFNKDLDQSFIGRITLKSANGSVVTTTPSFVSSNKRQLRIAPSTSLASNTSYSVDIAGGALQDSTGNIFVGLNGATSWTFRTLSPDTKPPVIKTAKMHDNSTIRLTYDKWLSSTGPLSTSYTVTVNGENRNVSSTYTSGDSVYVVLDTGVAVGQVVRIAYAPGTTGNRVTDQSYNAAAAFGARDVENGLDSVMSKPREGNAYYSTITLYYPETVYITSSDAARQFSVTADQSNVGINSISINGSSVVTLNLSRSITDGEVVRVAYTPGAWPVKDTRGQALAGFSGFYVRNSIDTKPPEFKSAEVSGNKLWVRYNEPLSTTNKPTNSQYSVLVDGKPVYVNASVIEDDLVTLTLASAVKETQNISLSYVPGSLRLTDLNNNPAGYLNLTPVTYTYGNGKILSATIQGDTVQINFRDAIQAEAALTLPQFSVVVNSSTATILSATASGSVVTLKLDTSTIGTTTLTGTVSYVPGAVPIRDASSVTVPAFGPLALQQTTNTNVNNNQTGSRPVWVTEMDTSNYGQPLLVMNNNTASAVPAMSHFNRSTRQFNVDGAKLIQTFEYASASGKLNQPIVFEIPDSEASAFVGFPLNALTQLTTSYRTGSIGVKYGDRLWTVPLANLDLAAMSRSLGTIGVSTVVTPINTSAATGASAPSFYVQLETVPMSSSGTMEGLIASARAQKLANSTDVYAFASSGTNNQRVEQKVKSQLAMQLAANTPSLTSGFAFVDPVTFKLSNVPSSFKNIASGVVIQGKLNGNQEIVPINNVVSYPDTASHWASEVIKELSAKWIISAPNGSYYRPNENISRAEFAELVARGLGLSGEPTAASRFPDVRSGSITSAYIGAAAEAGIITGNTDGTFKPDRPITREQMAIMMVRALNYGGKQTVLNSSSTSILSKFNDNKKIQSKDSVAKAVQEGIIQGMTSRTFEPQGNATRAQAAVMLKRVLDKLGYL